MIALLFAFMLAPLGQPVERSIEASRIVLAETFDVSSRVRFKAWPARSPFVLSENGKVLYFAENGPDGLALKSATLRDGSVVVVAKLNADYHEIATIPNDSDHLVLGEGSAWSNSARKVVSLDLHSGLERTLDIGEIGGNGFLLVSPSGRYVTTGINYQCHSGDRDCFAEDWTIISLATGHQEYTFRWPVLREKVKEQQGDTRPLVDLIRYTPRSLDLKWTSDDCLSVVPAEVIADYTPWKVCAPGAGQWIKEAGTPAASAKRARHAAVQTIVVTPRRGQNRISIPVGASGRLVELDAEALFELGYSRISILPGGDSTIIVKADPAAGSGWEGVEVVVLSPRSQTTSK